MRGWVQSYSWNKDLLFYFLFDYDSYHLSIAFFNRSFNEGEIGIMKFRDDEHNCSIYLWVNSSLQQQRYQKSEYVQFFSLLLALSWWLIFLFIIFCFYISGLGQDDSEYGFISDIVTSEEDYRVRSQILAAFKRSGFAKDSAGRYKLLPCEFGTYVNASAETVKCIECPAGKFIRSSWKLHNYIVGIKCLHC